MSLMLMGSLAKLPSGGGGGGGVPVRLLETPYTNSTSGQATHTTPSVTPVAGRPIAIILHVRGGTTGIDTFSAATFGAVDVLSSLVGTNQSRAGTYMFVVQNPDATSQAFSCTFSTSTGPRAVVIEIIQLPDGYETTGQPEASATNSSTTNELTLTVTTLTNNAMNIYAVSMGADEIPQAWSGVDGSFAMTTSLAGGGANDTEGFVAYEVVPTAGSSSGTLASVDELLTSSRSGVVFSFKAA